MATTTWNVSKDARIAYRTSDGWSAGAGASPYIVSGLYSGYKYRSLLGFSYSFSGMTSLDSATLYLKTSPQYYVAFGSDPDIYVQRLTQSWSEGTSVSLSGTNAVEWSNQPNSTTSNRATLDVSTAENTWVSVNITALMQDAFAAGTFYGLLILAVDETTATDVTEFWAREGSTSNDAYISVTYSTNTAPNAPTSLTPTGSTILNTLTPTLAGTFSDPDVGDTMSGYQIILYEDNGTTQKWDSGTITASGSTFSKVYNGAALTGNTYYQWKARTKDAAGAWGAYSALQRFKVNSVPNAPTISLTQTPTTDVKTLTPTFNVTHSDPDASDTQMLGYRIILETSGGSAVWDSGDVTVTATTTKAVVYPGSPALSWQSSYRWRARTKDSNGAWGAYSSNATFTTHTTGVPISLDPTGSEIASSITPTFTGSRATTSDSLTSAQIEVYESNGTTLKWDSGTFTSGVTSSTFSKIYAGAALTPTSTYKWRARVTSSVGGTSAWSSLQTFIAPDTNTPSGDSPVGNGITPVTNLQFNFSRAASFNIHELYLYQSDGTTVVTSDTPTSYTATTSKSFTYTGTLSWNTTYKWKVRVSSDGGSNWSPFTGLISFTTDSAGIPTLDAPASDAWLGDPIVVDNYDTTTNVVNGTSASTSIDTAAADKQTGRGSLKIALSTLTAATTSETYRTVALDLSNYGNQTPIKIYVRASTLTNLSTVRVRFTSTTTADYAEYTITPGSTAWEQKTVTKGSPAATGGTMDWSNITRIGIRVTAGGSAYTGNINVDDLKLDATNPSFDGTTFNSEVISTFRVRVYASNQTTLVWDSGDTAGSGTTFSIAYGGTALTPGLDYFWQARYVKSTGPTGNYSGMQPFMLNSAPNAPATMSPETGDVIADSLTPTFQSTFSDADKTTQGDTPSIWEVEIYRNSDSVLAYSLLKDASLIGGTNTMTDGDAGLLKTTGAANPLAYETEYKYRSRYTDSLGAVGAWSSYLVFKPSQSPVTTISSPADSGTVTSPAFNITWGHTSSGGKGQNSYQLRVVNTTNSVAVLDTGRVYTSSQTYAFPAGLLQNAIDYAISVRVWDTDGLVSAYDTNTVTTSWTAPDPVSNFVGTDDVSRSAVVLEWEPSNLAAEDFRRYTIYRKLASESNWTLLTELTNQSTVAYLDFMTANTVTYEYKITQWKIVPGDADLESGDSDISAVTLDADSWFVVGADRAESHIFELPVTAAPFVEPVQQEVFEPLGTSRKVIIRGKTLGAEGNLQCKWPDAERATAQMQVNYIKSNAGPHILKSPFGDIWLVEFSGPSKEYEGGGHMTANLVWTEVDE